MSYPGDTFGSVLPIFMGYGQRILSSNDRARLKKKTFDLNRKKGRFCNKRKDMEFSEWMAITVSPKLNILSRREKTKKQKTEGKD